MQMEANMPSMTPAPPIWAQGARVPPPASPDTTGRWIIKRQQSTSRWVSSGQDLAILGPCWWSRIAGVLLGAQQLDSGLVLRVWASHLLRSGWESQPDCAHTEGWCERACSRDPQFVALPAPKVPQVCPLGLPCPAPSSQAHWEAGSPEGILLST